MNTKSVRLQILHYLHEYFGIKNKKIVKKGRKVKTEADVLREIFDFCSLVKKEGVEVRKDLKEKIIALQGKADEKKMRQIMEELENYSNANEDAILQQLINLLEAFEQERDKQKKKEILIKIEDFVYGITSNENLEVSWDLFTFLNECFFIYYNHNEHKADIDYGLNPKEDKQIEMSVTEKLSFLKEVVQD